MVTTLGSAAVAESGHRGFSLSLLQAPSGRIALIILFAGLVLATLTDLRERKIRNSLTFPLALLAFLVHGIFGGGYALLSSVAAYLLWFALGFLFYQTGARKGIGAGDIKLVMACGALVGFWPCLHIAFVSFLFQVVFMMIRWVVSGRARQNFERIGLWLKTLAAPGTYKVHFESAGPQDKSPHGPFLLAGAAAVIALWWRGWLLL